MSALTSCSAAAPFVARAAVASSPSTKRATTAAARKGASNRRGITRLSAVTEPVETSTSADPIEAFCADQMPDEAAMLAASTFPISPEVSHACVRECACALLCVCRHTRREGDGRGGLGVKMENGKWQQ